MVSITVRSSPSTGSNSSSSVVGEGPSQPVSTVKPYHLVTWLLLLLALLCICPTLALTFEYHESIGEATHEYGSAEDNDEIDKALGVIPEFESPSESLVAVAGEVAVLPCAIVNLGKFKVAWLDSSSVALTLEDRRLIDDSRYSIDRPQVKHWNLQIREVRKDDEGQYMCTINTFPVKSRNVTLHINVPAQIIVDQSSGDSAVREGSNLTLACRATGVPLPNVTWYRQSFVLEKEALEKSCSLGTYNSGRHLRGELIEVLNISRHCGGIYECRASNGVSKAVYRRTRVTVEFGPVVRLKNSRISQLLGRETILECEIEAFPHHVNYWEKEKRKVSSSDRHRIDAFVDPEDIHRLTLSLRIDRTTAADYGEYKCVALNSIGSDTGTMHLVEQKPSLQEMTSKGKAIRDDTVITMTSSTSAHSAQTKHRTQSDNLRPFPGFADNVVSALHSNAASGLGRRSSMALFTLSWFLVWFR